MAKPVKVRTSSGEWVDLAIQVPSANEPTFTGTTSSSQFSATNSVGDEGGEIKFAKAATNTTLNTGVTLDVYQDKVRLFETAGTNRGGYFDMTTLGAGVSTNLTPGLTLISSTTFTTASSINITGCFSSTYDYYRIILTPSAASANLDLRWRMLSGTTAESSSNYYYAYRGLTFTNGNADSNASAVSSWFIGTINTADPHQTAVTLDLLKPFLATNTTYTMTSSNSNGSVYYSQTGSGLLYTANSYNGIQVFTSTGTANGTIKVYGYRN